HPGRRRQVLVQDRLVELGRLLEWRDGELPVEDGHALPIGVDGPGAVPRPGAEEHEEPVGGLVKWIEVDPSRRSGGRRGVVAGGSDSRRPTLAAASQPSAYR